MQRMHKTIIILAALSVIYLLSGASVYAQNILRNYTPASWQAADVQWGRDVYPHNYIDDLIDASKEDTFKVIVNYGRCVEDYDVDLLNNVSLTSQVIWKSRYISSVVVSNVTKENIETIANMNGVAFVEGAWPFDFELDISLQNIKVIGDYYSDNLEDNYPDIDGSGKNIAIFDSGVDDHQHDTFGPSQFIGGYDALIGDFGNPDDEDGHGTAMASIALGQGGTFVSRGVAPGAGLIDILKPAFNEWERFGDILEIIYDNRENWNGTGEKVHIINMSFSQVNPETLDRVISDGTDAFSQLIDLAEAMGIIIVAAVGNDREDLNIIASPAAASRAITVAGSYCPGDDPDRGNSILYFRSSKGPRQDDWDMYPADELKPEVTAPAQEIDFAQHNSDNGIFTHQGTSLAAAHVSGLSALILEDNPGINAASVKDLIIRTAEMVDPTAEPWDLSIDDVWNEDWGWGLVDAYGAIAAEPVGDIGFPHHPPDPLWLSPDIEADPEEPQAGIRCWVVAIINNYNDEIVENVRVSFGTHVYSASIYTFNDIGTRIVDLDPGLNRVGINWFPAHSDHQCLQVEIGYGFDNNFGNNKAARNLYVSGSPVKFEVKNTVTTDTATIRFYPEGEYDTVDWKIFVEPDSIVHHADDCPEKPQIWIYPPPYARPGSTQVFHVSAKHGATLLGGVSVKKEVIMPPIFDSISEAQNLTFHFFKDGQYWQEPWEYIYWVSDYDLYYCDHHTGILNFREEHPELEEFAVKCGFYRQSGPDGWRQTIFYHGGVSDVMVLEPLLPPQLAEPWRIPDIAPGWPADFDTIYTAVNMDEYLLSNPSGFKDGNWAVGETLNNIDIFVKGGVVEGLRGIYWATSEFVIDKSSPSGFRPGGGDDSYLNSETYDGSLIIIAEHYGGIETGTFCCEIAGDADHNQVVNLLDITYLINYLYKNGAEPVCYHEGNADGSGEINILDVTHLISYLYKAGDIPICPIM